MARPAPRVAPATTATWGHFTLGTNNDFINGALRCARNVIVEVNENMPRVHGDAFLHIRDVTAVVENHIPLPPVVRVSGGAEDKKIADLIAAKLRLSARERQIVQAVINDEKELAIAWHLGISRHTVHTYLQRIYQKLDVASRVQLVVHILSEYIKLQATPANPSTRHDSEPASPPKR